MTRDPRKDPQKGDVLLWCGHRRTVHRTSPASVWWCDKRGVSRQSRWKFQDWAFDAEVVTGEG